LIPLVIGPHNVVFPLLTLEGGAAVILEHRTKRLAGIVAPYFVFSGQFFVCVHFESPDELVSVWCVSVRFGVGLGLVELAS
jgi:hypothetical protein